MKPAFFSNLSNIWSVHKESRMKVLLLGLVFFCLSACQAIWRPLKSSIFAKIVGAHAVANAKLYFLFYLVPLLIFYSFLVDRLKRHQLLYIFSLFHGIGGAVFFAVFSYFPIATIQTTPSLKAFGWLFYFLMESFSAFLSTVFWSFANSINTPEEAQNTYGFLVMGSKIGGVLAAGTLYLALNNVATSLVPTTSALLPQSIFAGCLLLFASIFAVIALIRLVPENQMLGYRHEAEEIEDSIDLEEEEIKSISLTKKIINSSLRIIRSPQVVAGIAISLFAYKLGYVSNLWLPIAGTLLATLLYELGVFDGLLNIVKYPYVAGITSLVLLYEIMIVILDYRVLLTADAAYSTAESLTQYYALQYMCMHGIGLFFVLFGTVPLQRLSNIRVALFAFPLVSSLLVSATYFWPTPFCFFITLVLVRALNYAVNHPTRETLYIPTTKAIRYKAKAWTDAFGSRLAKAAGSLFNIITNSYGTHVVSQLSAVVNAGIISIWLLVASSLGVAFVKTVEEKKLIGEKPKKSKKS